MNTKTSRRVHKTTTVLCFGQVCTTQVSVQLRIDELKSEVWQYVVTHVDGTKVHYT